MPQGAFSERRLYVCVGEVLFGDALHSHGEIYCSTIVLKLSCYIRYSLLTPIITSCKINRATSEAVEGLFIQSGSDNRYFDCLQQFQNITSRFWLSSFFAMLTIVRLK